MLTWAIVYLASKFGETIPLLLIVAMGCDVGIFYYIAAACGARL